MITIIAKGFIIGLLFRGAPISPNRFSKETYYLYEVSDNGSVVRVSEGDVWPRNKLFTGSEKTWRS